METINWAVSEWWNQGLLMYRTMAINHELKRRKSMTDTRNSHSEVTESKGSVLSDQTGQSGGHSITPADGSTIEGTCSPVYEWDRSEMKRVFDLFDENKDGYISAEELQRFMKKLLGNELSDDKVRDMVRTVDRNGDECVEFDEFFSLYSSLCGEESPDHHPCVNVEQDRDEETLLEAFFVFDENRDGMISAHELQHVLLKLGLPQGRSLMGCQKMIERVDADGNGHVDFFEFKDMMRSNAFTF